MNVLNSWGDSPAVDEIRQLVQGPARSDLKDAALRWIEVHKQALESHRTKGTCEPRSPWPMKERDLNFETGCAALVAIYHRAGRGYTRLFEPRNDDIVGGVVWLLLEESVCKWPPEYRVSEILAFVRTELQKRGVLPAGDDKSVPTTVAVALGVDGAQHEPLGRAPKVYLTSWREILSELNLKSDQQGKVARLNQDFGGPIISGGQGTQPKVEKGTLLVWWEGVEDQFNEGRQRQQDAKVTVSDQHSYGDGGIVFPEIKGGERKRRRDYKQ